MKKTVQSDITIVGTGLAGLTAALALATDHIVTLIGPMPNTKQDERTTAILSPGIAFLDGLGVWMSCAARATPLRTMQLIDGDKHFVFDASETAFDEFGFNVPNATLRQSLSGLIAKHRNITWIKESVTQATRAKNRWQLTTASRKKITADLVIAADGRNSLMRKAAEIEIDERDENQTALVAVLTTSQAHHDTSVEWYRPGGPFTLVPMAGKKMALVWCEDDDTAQMKTQQSLGALSREITDITAKRFGTLTFTAQPQTWPIKPMKAKTLIKDDVVLIGEAAHTLPPIGAQGLNTSLHDIAVLQDCLRNAKLLGLDITDRAGLRPYEQARLSDVNRRYHAMTGLNDLIRTQHPALQFLRGAGLRALNRFAPLKKQIMQFGLGARNSKGKAA